MVQRVSDMRQSGLLPEEPSSLGMMDALGLPQEKLKSAVAMNDAAPSRWTSDSIYEKLGAAAPFAYAAVETAGDVFLDPLNALGGGLITAGTKGVKAAGKAAKSLGMDTATRPATYVAAGGDNFIDDFYGISKSRYAEELENMSSVEKMLVDTVMPWLRENPEIMEKIPLVGAKVNNKVKAVKADRAGPYKDDYRPKDLTAVRAPINTALMVMAAAKGGLKDLMSPNARALWRQYGITPQGQRNLSANLDKYFAGDAKRGLENKNIQKATSIVHMMSHTGRQGGRLGGVSPDMAKIMKMSSREDYAPYSSGRLSEWFARNTDEVSPQQAKVFEEQVIDAWKGDLPTGSPDIVIMKAPRNKMSGDHASDIISDVRHQNPVVKQYKKFSEGQGVEDLRGLMVEGQYNKEGKRLYTVLDGIDDPNGVWVKWSRVGNAVTEGGIGSITRVDTAGNMASIMGDVHNFLEKVPGMAKAAEAATPLSLLAVSPVVRKNFFGKAVPKQEAGGQLSNEGALEALQGIATQKPTQAAVDVVNAETKGAAQAAAGAGIVGAGMFTGPNGQE